jgi:hypothetical protein
MPASVVDCTIASIPARLHSRGRAPVASLRPTDWLYLRHPPQGKLWYGSHIKGHDHLDDQSVHSRLLNKPHGSPRDVFYNEEDGSYYWGWGIAAFSVRQIRALCLPNPNTPIKKVKGPPPGLDVYTFSVCHRPTPCLYPHCEIHAYKNGNRLTRNIRNSMKSLIRKRFARLGDRNRFVLAWHLLLASLSPGFVKLLRWKA